MIFGDFVIFFDNYLQNHKNLEIITINFTFIISSSSLFMHLLQKNIPITKNHVHVQGILAIYPWFLDILQFSFHFIHQASVTSDLSGCFAGLIVYSMGSINQLHFHNHQSYPSFFHHHHTKGNGWSKKVNFNNWKMKLKINFTFIIINHLHHHHNQLHFHNHKSHPSFFHHHHTKGNGWSKKVNFNNWKMKLNLFL